MPSLRCTSCTGRGWRSAPREGAWPETCPTCGGRGKFTVYRLAKLLEEDARSVRKVLMHEAGEVLTDRIRAGLMRLGLAMHVRHRVRRVKAA